MKHILSLSVFIALAIMVWWSITSNYNDTDSLQQTTSTDYAQIFMNKFEMTSMDENGKPNYILNGSYLQRANDSDDTKIELPVFQLFQENKHWEVSAKNAIINDKKETIQLKNNVLMQQKNIEPAVTIRTQYLLINTKTQIAQTQTAVDITHGKSHLTSDGMIFNNTTNELDLTPNVNGRYLPYE
jgi:lipopolysaccharide export system protein LptC